jgi:addiction module HigA family antidote
VTPEADGFSYKPDYSVPPGETLNEVLFERGMSQSELARRAGLSVKHVNQISQGLAAISVDTALRFEAVTGIPARVWTNLDADYQVKRKRQQEERKLSSAVDWLKLIPVNELVKRKCIGKNAEGVEQLREVLRFFQVAEPEAWEQVWAVPTAYRLSQAFSPEYGALAAWLRIGEIRASKIGLPDFNQDGFRSALANLRRVTVDYEPNLWLSSLRRMCADVGVALVVEKEIKGARVNGAVRWLPSGNPLIMLSLRHRWSDIVLFTFFHEVGHLLIHDRKRLTLVDGAHAGAYVPSGQQISGVMEAEADEFASRILIPKQYEALMSQLVGPDEIKSAAAEIGIHPGIIVGRLQHDRRIEYSQMNDMRLKFNFPGEKGPGLPVDIE